MSYMTASYLRSCIHYAGETGVPVAQVLAAFGITATELEDDEHCIDVERMDQGFRQLETLTGDLHVGLHSGLHMNPSHLGVLGMLLMTCKRTRELFDLHSRYGKLVSNATWADYAQRDGYFCMTLHDQDSQRRLSRHRTEYSLAGWTRLARWIMGNQFEMVRLDVAYAPVDDGTELQQLMSCPIRFECAETRAYFPEHYADQPLAVGESRLRKMLEVEAQQRLVDLLGQQTEADALLAEIKQVIAQQLSLGGADIESVARHFGESTRSLQRRLETRGTRFSLLVDLVRIELAQRLMLDAKLALADIALLLGFADQSAFQRAFKRWFNLTPGEYRRQR